MPTKNSFRRAAAKAVASGKRGSKVKYSKVKSGPRTIPTSDSGTDDEDINQTSSENLAKLPTLSEEEYIFFKLVRDGDLNGLKDFMKSDLFQKIHINKTDKFGFSAMHHAVRRQDEEMVSILLSQEGILTYDTLFHSIQEENIPITLKLLKYEDDNKPPPLANQQQQNMGRPLNASAASTALAVGAPSASLSQTGVRSPTKVSSKKSLQDLEDFDSEFPAYLTPMMKAAQIGNTELMELFYSRGERLESQEENHNCGCSCRICSKNDKSLTSAYERLHLFDALTNPNYICFLSGKQKVNFDPVNYAIDKLTKCRELQEREQSFEDKYKEYIGRLGEFIRDFLDLCRTNEETETFMSVPEPEKEWSLPGKYPRLWKLVGLQLVNVVAHPHAQHIVYKQWTSSAWPEWNTFSFFRRVSEVLIRAIFLPFIAIFLWFGSKSKWGRRLSCPVSRYLTWVASYLLFLVLVFAQTILPQRCNNDAIPYSVLEGKCDERGEPNIGTEWPIILYVFGFYVSMLKRHSIPWLWSSAWSWYELVNQLFFTATFLCWLLAWAYDHGREDRKTWGQYYPEILAEAFLTISVIMSFGRAFRFIQLHQTIGPLQIALGRMVKSFFSVAFVYSIMILSFSTGLNAIYVPYNDMAGFDKDGNAKKQNSPFGRVLSSSEELFWGLFGMSASDKPAIVQVGAKMNDNTIDIRHHWVNELAGKFLFGSYNVLGVLMMFNMLIAYFSGHADEVFENADAEWKFARTQIYMTYQKDTVLPPPFNLIPTLRGILRFFEYIGLLCLGDGVTGKASCSLRQCCFIDEPRDYDDDRRKRRSYRRLILQLTHRYKGFVVDKANKEPATSDDVKEIGEELAELKSQVESKLRELEETQAQVTDTQSSTTLKKVSSEELDILKDQSTSITNHTSQAWSRGKRILFHKTNKGLVSKMLLTSKSKSSAKGPQGGLFGTRQAPSGGLVASQAPSGGLVASQAPLAGLIVGKTPSAGLIASKAPSAGLVASKAPSPGLVATKTPSAGLVATKAPSAGLVAGKTPSAGLIAGKTPSAGLIAGKTPSAGLIASKAPSAGLIASKAPSPGLVANKTPSTALVDTEKRLKSVPPSPPNTTPAIKPSSTFSNGGLSSSIKFSAPPPPPPPPVPSSSLPPKPPAPITSGPDIAFSSAKRFSPKSSHNISSKSPSGTNRPAV